MLGPLLFILYTQLLSDITDRYSVFHHMFADGTEFYRSTDRYSISFLLTAMRSCVSDAKDWSLVEKLQLSEDKTEALLLDPSQFANLPASLQIGQTCVHCADTARNLGVIFDNNLSMRDQVSKVCQTAYLEIRTGSVRKYLTTKATKTPVPSLVIPRLD